MIHAASLFHDDVIDEADTRRGVPSVNKVFGNKLAILAGKLFVLLFAFFPSLVLRRMLTFGSFIFVGESYQLGLRNNFVFFFFAGESLEEKYIRGGGGYAAQNSRTCLRENFFVGRANGEQDLRGQAAHSRRRTSFFFLPLFWGESYFRSFFCRRTRKDGVSQW